MIVLRALLYARVSSPAQKRRSQASLDEPSLAQQREEMRQAARQRGWTVVAELEDVITGGVPVKDRPAGALIYDKARNDAFDLLVVYDNDRIGRDEDAVVAKVFRADLRQQRKQIFSVHQPVEPRPPAEYQPYEDDSTLWLESVTDTASSVAIRQFRRRHAFGMRKRVEVKKLMAGMPAVGYVAARHTLPSGKVVLGERTPDPRYVPLIRRVFNEYEGGKSLMGIAGLLNQEGFRTPSGKLWTEGRVRDILDNPIYFGAAVYYRRRSTGAPDPKHPGRRLCMRMPVEQWLIVDDAQHPAIISREQWERCQQIKRSRRTVPRTFGESALLSGLLRCGHCGAAMYKNSNWKGGYYTCSRYWKCGKVECRPNRIRRTTVEDEVLAFLADLATSPAISEKLQVSQSEAGLTAIDEQVNSLREQLQSLEARLRKVREAYEAGVDSVTEYRCRKEELLGQQQQLQTELARATNALTLANQQRTVRSTLPELVARFPGEFRARPLHIQKMLLRAILEKVLIRDGRVEIVFRVYPATPSEYERLLTILRTYSESE
jgi:site-specific DNA recombinase